MLTYIQKHRKNLNLMSIECLNTYTKFYKEVSKNMFFVKKKLHYFLTPLHKIIIKINLLKTYITYKKK